MGSLVVDVSDHNGSIAWRDVKAGGIDGAIARVCDGDLHDKLWSRGRAHDLHHVFGSLWGVYGYGRVASPGNNQRDGSKECLMMLRFAEAGGWHPQGYFPFAYDFENLNKQSAAKAAKHLVQWVERYHHETGTYPIIYTMPGLWNVVVGHLSPAERRLIARCPLWEADWTGAPDPIGPWRGAPPLHQFTDKYPRPRGMGGSSDMSRAHVKLQALVVGKKAKPDKHRPVRSLKAREKAWVKIVQRRRREVKRLTDAGAPADQVKAAQAAVDDAEASLRKVRAAIRPTGVPSWVPAKFLDHWRRPWTGKARNSPGFRRLLQAHGYLTPNFSIKEARCKDGSAIPASMVAACRNHAFNLERLRHRIGDRAIPVISWYRTPAYNRKVGGAGGSKHMEAIASDHPKEWVNAMGRDRVLSNAEIVFRNGGMGIYPGGNLHFDSRGVRARWSDWTPGK